MVKTPTSLDQQERVYQFIEGFIQRRGFPPTLREIKEGLSLPHDSVAKRYVDRLVKRGRVYRQKGSARALVLIK